MEYSVHRTTTQGAKLRQDSCVRRSKCAFLAGMLITALVSAALSGFFVFQSETATFQEKYMIYAREIAVRSFSNAADTFSTMRSMGIDITSYSIEQHVGFPFVTMPSWEERTYESRRISFDEMMAFAPLVHLGDKEAWEDYAFKHQDWVRAGLITNNIENEPGSIPSTVQDFPPGVEPSDFVSFVSIMNELSSPEQREWVLDAYRQGPMLNDSFVPLWQMGPAPLNASVVNSNLMTSPGVAQLLLEVLVNRHGVLCPFSIVGPKLLGGGWQGINTEAVKNVPHSGLIEPVMQGFEDDSPVVGFVIADVPWSSFFLGVLPEGVGQISVVIQDTCGNMELTLSLNGPEVTLLGFGDLHDVNYDHLVFERPWKSGPGSVVVNTRDQTNVMNSFNAPSYPHHCEFNIKIYPDESFHIAYQTGRPMLVSVSVLVIFLFCSLAFMLYDYAVVQRQRRLVLTAERTSNVLSDLFPESIQGRLLADAEAKIRRHQDQSQAFVPSRNKKLRLKQHLTGKDPMEISVNSDHALPMADLFAEVTVLCATISGFAAWSSTRDPQQVFILLESIYQSFDKIAKEHSVYKVDSTGDQYLAVCGLPEPCVSHATVMAGFALACANEFKIIIRKLGSTLGPDCTELGLCIGLHSGPITAGVLRGERSRFSLFELALSSPINCIQVSANTARLVQSTGDEHRITERVNSEHGHIKTYWLGLVSDEHQSVSLTSSQHLVEWNTRILADFLKRVVASRPSPPRQATNDVKALERSMHPDHRSWLVLDEVTEFIRLPRFDGSSGQSFDVSSVELEQEVLRQLRRFVATIAAHHNNNPFHNFEHASHVLLAVVKSLGRIVAPDDVADGKILHDHTFGITSDPLVLFSCVFSALIHDTEHAGVSNAVLVSENDPMAVRYENRSVGEQNSVDVAFRILLEDEYQALRRAIYQTPEELKRFRQLVVNAVAATDVWDAELNAMRKERWNKAFAKSAFPHARESQDDVDRKASTVLEHLITASDVSHCMQHQAIYLKWNKLLFHEQCVVFHQGRAPKHPTEYWYKGELSFFDNYIIPLAKKLESCGVFGVSSAEYLDYALLNRKEWEVNGQEIIAEYMEDQVLLGSGEFEI